ncbi:S-adenosyl-L-methionine-dependent methyltransferase [Aspergillus heteromorphus CBS 117.55]|uniref:S-adenosyl-L-methionine-dependent methyltransferase n=1 Tax=Aspergillus heteromorphus CBS 117.55 TaxID=1448321 RepID=A0A317WP39_9EURO|nr:S-adenosyl-L-methionine-dependent methyltransferase [Aspergillus heteromorphus CBS 117.55]PWY88163.1 S-adenosyl-L-methionine-dependent methyltransferase [Aspergillus heteromorphus CBS 117.55]
MSTAADHQPSRPSPADPPAIIVPEDSDADMMEGSGDYYAADTESYATSLSSSVFNFNFVNGRRFHSYQEGRYKFPNDEREQGRLNTLHHIFKLLMGGKLFLAPIDTEKPLRVLDIGTGTGMWAIEVGDAFPRLQWIVGNDLSPIQPTTVPPNVCFEVDDVEVSWPPRKPFDFIHARYMGGSIGDWPGLFKQAYEQLAPGGWIEFQEFSHIPGYSQDNSVPADNSVGRLYDLIEEGCNLMGRPATIGDKLPLFAADAGFINIQHQVFPIPMGAWPKDPHMKEIGAMNMLALLDGLEAFSIILFTQVLGWRPEEVTVFLAKVRQDTMKKGVHLLSNFNVMYAQKPLDETPEETKAEDATAEGEREEGDKPE